MPSTAPIVVIKLGSNALADEQGHLDLLFLDAMAQQVRAAVDAGWWPVVVSSGAVASGMASMGLTAKPSALPDVQALAAIGQAGLAHRWQVALAGHGLQGAQILLTGDDFQERQRYLNLAATFRSLAAYGVIPIINENDTISVAELTVGDNDRLSALVASQLGAQRLLLLTDIDGVYASDPRHNPQAQRFERLTRIDAALLASMGNAGLRGRGGMRSKLEAARLAMRAGVDTIIARAREESIVQRLLADEPHLGTRIPAQGRVVPSSRRRWLALARRPAGYIHIDAGAARAVRERGHSLLPAGITRVTGSFARGDTVAIVDHDGTELARGLSALAAAELQQICGLRLEDAATRLGYPIAKAAVHRDNMLVST
ncbi:MAG: glutamate 5-kinase [Planctomycetota bacterium]|nr:MAG: glutamate 5-kinase [Planctomycetota bacterium]